MIGKSSLSDRQQSSGKRTEWEGAFV